MITTLFLIQLIAFQLWYVTSKQVKHTDPPVYLRSMTDNRRTCRTIGGLLILLSTALFVVKLGWMSGICATIIALMAVGCLVVLLYPFRYISPKAVLLLYSFFLILEFFA